MGGARKKNSELHLLALEERQAAVDAKEHGLLIIFERPPEPPARPEDEPLSRDDPSK